MRTLFLSLVLAGGLLGAPVLTEKEPAPKTPGGDTRSIQIQVRLRDLEELKSCVPFRLGRWKVWRIKELSEFGDAPPQDWWAHVRLDMVIVFEKPDHETARKP